MALLKTCLVVLFSAAAVVKQAEPPLIQRARQQPGTVKAGGGRRKETVSEVLKDPGENLGEVFWGSLQYLLFPLPAVLACWEEERKQQRKRFNITVLRA